MELDDGTVVPSFLSISSTSMEKSARWHSFNDTSLRVGQIIASYSPNDSGNTNKKVAEYDISVDYADSHGAQTRIVYYRAKVASLFGGVADFIRWTPRLDNKNIQSDVSFSSYVLVLCINGNQRSCYILGGLPHPDSQTPDNPVKDNHYLDFEFNGINVFISKDGTLLVSHKGATNPDGTIIDETGRDSAISLTKEGNINLGYLNKLQTGIASIVIKKDTKTVNLFAESDVRVNTKAEFNISTNNGVKINDTGFDQQAFLRSTIYRQQQELMHNTIGPLLSSLSSLIITAGASLTVAGGLHVIPMVGAILGAPAVTAAGGSLTAAGPLLLQIQVAIQQFEALSSQYLSNQHFHAETP